MTKPIEEQFSGKQTAREQDLKKAREDADRKTMRTPPTTPDKEKGGGVDSKK